MIEGITIVCVWERERVGGWLCRSDDIALHNESLVFLQCVALNLLLFHLFQISFMSNLNVPVYYTHQ